MGKGPGFAALSVGALVLAAVLVKPIGDAVHGAPSYLPVLRWMTHSITYKRKPFASHCFPSAAGGGRQFLLSPLLSNDRSGVVSLHDYRYALHLAQLDRARHLPRNAQLDTDPRRTDRCPAGNLKVNLAERSSPRRSDLYGLSPRKNPQKTHKTTENNSDHIQFAAGSASPVHAVVGFKPLPLSCSEPTERREQGPLRRTV